MIKKKKTLVLFFKTPFKHLQIRLTFSEELCAMCKQTISLLYMARQPLLIFKYRLHTLVYVRTPHYYSSCIWDRVLAVLT